MAIRPSKRRHSYHVMEDGISLTSLLDMITILVVFLLVTAVFAKTAVIDTYLPKEESTSELAGKIPEVLIIMTGEDGFRLAGLGGEKFIPAAGGRLDYKELTGELIKIKESNPEKEEVVLLFSPQISYDIVVKVMDASRESKGEKLFPLVSLGEGR